MDIPKDVNRIEFYKQRIQDEIDAYKLTLPDETLLYKVGPFRGLLKHISVNVFKADRPITNKTDRNVNFDDPGELDQLWDIYVSLSYAFNQNISLHNFAMFTGIDYNTFLGWSNVNNITVDDIGNDNGDSYNNIVLNTTLCSREKHNIVIYKSMIKRWMNECESNLADHTARENSVGSMFLLKAVYGYSEQPQRIEITTDNSQVDRAALMDKYKDQERPQLPDNSDNSDTIDN